MHVVQTNPQELSYEVAKKVCTPQELERLACAYLSATEPVSIDAEKAARTFGGSAKPDSFRRVMSQTLKKIKDAMEGGDGDAAADGDGDETKAKPKGKGGRKRKAPADGGDEASAKKKGRGARKGGEEVDEADGAPVKAEARGSDAEEDGLLV